MEKRMKRKNRDIHLTYCDPTELERITDSSQHTKSPEDEILERLDQEKQGISRQDKEAIWATNQAWVTFTEDINLGHRELKTLLKLADKADLSMPEFICVYLYYWEKLTEQEIAKKVDLSQQRIFQILNSGKNKLYPELQKLVKMPKNRRT